MAVNKYTARPPVKTSTPPYQVYPQSNPNMMPNTQSMPYFVSFLFYVVQKISVGSSKILTAAKLPKLMFSSKIFPNVFSNLPKIVLWKWTFEAISFGQILLSFYIRFIKNCSI